MVEEIRKRFFPMELPSGTVARSMDQRAAQQAIETINHLIFPADFKQEAGLFEPPEAREDTYFIDTIGLVPAYRGRGIYTAFLRQLIDYLTAMGYERLTTSHHPSNRAALIADLKVGFDIVGLELDESNGVLVKTAYHLHEDRRQAFERVFRTPREPTDERDPRANAG
jgi:RimJ/RimL family protein N-acetyltransferase